MGTKFLCYPLIYSKIFQDHLTYASCCSEHLTEWKKRIIGFAQQVDGSPDLIHNNKRISGSYQS